MFIYVSIINSKSNSSLDLTNEMYRIQLYRSTKRQSDEKTDQKKSSTDNRTVKSNQTAHRVPFAAFHTNCSGYPISNLGVGITLGYSVRRRKKKQMRGGERLTGDAEIIAEERTTESSDNRSKYEIPSDLILVILRPCSALSIHKSSARHSFSRTRSDYHKSDKKTANL